MKVFHIYITLLVGCVLMMFNFTGCKGPVTGTEYDDEVVHSISNVLTNAVIEKTSENEHSGSDAE